MMMTRMLKATTAIALTLLALLAGPAAVTADTATRLSTFSVINGDMVVAWNMLSNATASYINLTMTSYTGRYMAVGWSYGGGMNAYIIACDAPTLAAPVPPCRDVLGFANDVTARPRTHVVTGSGVRADGGGWVTIVSRASDLGILNGTQRVLYAQGLWDAGTNLPRQHGSTALRGKVNLDTYAGIRSGSTDSSRCRR